MGQTQTQELYQLAAKLEQSLRSEEVPDEHTKLCYQIILAMRSAAPNVKNVSGKREVLGHYNIGQVLPFLPRFGEDREREYVIGNHYFRVKMFSSRYKMFLDNLACVNCGVVGTVFKLERMTDGLSDRAHFNLYAVHPITGEYVLMTKDHILPKAKGGKDSLSNYQTMCTYCNNHKGDTLEEKFNPLLISRSFKKKLHFNKFTDWISPNQKWIVTLDRITGYSAEHPAEIRYSGRAIDLATGKEVIWLKLVDGSYAIKGRLPLYIQKRIKLLGVDNEKFSRDDSRSPQEETLSRENN